MFSLDCCSWLLLLLLSIFRWPWRHAWCCETRFIATRAKNNYCLQLRVDLELQFSRDLWHWHVQHLLQCSNRPFRHVRLPVIFLISLDVFWTFRFLLQRQLLLHVSCALLCGPRWRRDASDASIFRFEEFTQFGGWWSRSPRNSQE